MKTEQEIKSEYKKFLEKNPKSWIYSTDDAGLIGWFLGFEAAIQFVLEESNK